MAIDVICIPAAGEERGLQPPQHEGLCGHRGRARSADAGGTPLRRSATPACPSACTRPPHVCAANETFNVSA